MKLGQNSPATIQHYGVNAAGWPDVSVPRRSVRFPNRSGGLRFRLIQTRVNDLRPVRLELEVGRVVFVVASDAKPILVGALGAQVKKPSNLKVVGVRDVS